MTVLGSIADSKGPQNDNIGKMVKAVADLVQHHQSSKSAMSPDAQRSTAAMVLSRLEADEGVCSDEAAMYVVEEAASVLHGSAQGAAERMASRICVMAEQALPPLECVRRLRAFLHRDTARTSTGSVPSVGHGARDSVAE